MSPEQNEQHPSLQECATQLVQACFVEQFIRVNLATYTKGFTAEIITPIGPIAIPGSAQMLHGIRHVIFARYLDIVAHGKQRLADRIIHDYRNNDAPPRNTISWNEC